MRVLTGEEKFFCDLCGKDVTETSYPLFPRLEVMVEISLVDGRAHEYHGTVAFDQRGKHTCFECAYKLLKAVAEHASKVLQDPAALTPPATLKRSSKP